MPIGKDSITKRVAKTTNEEKIAPELVATTAAAPAAKTTAKKSTSTAKKATTTKKPSTAKKPAAPKAETVKETLTPPTEAPEKMPVVDTAVLANVSPETVAAVIGHKEDEKYEKVQIGQKMPSFLL